MLATGFALAAKLGKIPVQAGICDGFIGNRILKRYRAAAEDLVRRGVAIADVDAAMRAFGFAMGPFEAQDLGGLDIACFSARPPAPAARLARDARDVLVRAGRKGQKTGGGWYDYAPGDRTPRPRRRGRLLLAPLLIGCRRGSARCAARRRDGGPKARRSSPRASPHSRPTSISSRFTATVSRSIAEADVPQRPVVPEHSRR